MALAGVVVNVLAFGREVWQDSGAFVLVLYGVPLVLAAVALWAERATRSILAPAVVGASGVVSTAWALVNAGGVGFGLAPSALLLLFAAVFSWTDRRGVRSPAEPRT